MAVPQKIRLPEDPAILLLGIYPEDAPTCNKDTCSTMFIAALFITVRSWKEPRCPSTEETQMAVKHLEKCSAPLVIREMQIKTTLRLYLTAVRMAKMKNSGDSRCWRGCGERGTLLQY